jgi:hypothetical protein
MGSVLSLESPIKKPTRFKQVQSDRANPHHAHGKANDFRAGFKVEKLGVFGQ